MSRDSVQRYARIAGVLFLLTMVAGGFGELIVPRLIVSADPGATARNIVASDSLFRLAFAGYLVEALCDVALAWLLYVLLRRVHQNLSLLAAFFGLVSTAVYAVAELFYFAALLILNGGTDYLKTFSPDQVQGLAFLSLTLFKYGGGLFFVFYGVASILRGYLIFQSGYLPRFLGVLVALGGAGFVVLNFALVLAPAYASDILLLPMMLAVVAMTAWFLARGVDIPKWEAKAATQP
jgi:uncharacterized protein DUF4386